MLNLDWQRSAAFPQGAVYRLGWPLLLPQRYQFPPTWVIIRPGRGTVAVRSLPSNGWGIAMSIFVPFLGRLKIKPIYAVRSSERVLFRFGEAALTLLRKENARGRRFL